MPSGTATVRDTRRPSEEVDRNGPPAATLQAGSLRSCRSAGAGQAHQGYQPAPDGPDVVVDQHLVELRPRRELDPRGLEPTRDDVGRFGAAPDQPAYELVPARRLEEDEQRVRHGGADLARPVQLDLEEH